MVEPGDIIEAKAILSAIDRQSTLLIELRLKLDAIDTKLATDRNYFDSSLQVLENLSHAIQGTIQIEQTKSDRFTNLLIASVGS